MDKKIKRLNFIKFIIDIIILVGMIIGVSGIVDDKLVIAIYTISLVFEIITSDIIINKVEKNKNNRG